MTGQVCAAVDAAVGTVTIHQIVLEGFDHLDRFLERKMRKKKTKTSIGDVCVCVCVVRLCV